jgi:hypothetical protein
LEAKRKGFEAKRKSLLAGAQGDLEMTLEQETKRRGELEATKELLNLPLFDLARRKDDEILPLSLETKPLGEQSWCLDFETKRKEEDDRRKEQERKRKDQLKMTK